jgi:hypothetical protein
VGHGILILNNNGVTPATMFVRGNLVMATQMPGNTDVNGATGVINVNGGILNVAGDIIDGSGASTLNIDGGGLVDLKPDGDTVAGNLSVDTLSIIDGTLTNYSVLAVSTIALPGPVTQLTVYPGQILAPAGVAKTGTLNVTGNLQLRGTAELDVAKNGAILSSDKIVTTGVLDLGGALKVRVIGGALAIGDKFTLISGTSVANSFASLELSSPGAGLAWTNRLAVDGSIQVIASGEPTDLPSLTLSAASGSVTISWPSAYTSFTLRGQTNSISTGVSGNWGTVAGAVNNQVVLPINTANGAVFFELFKP